MAQFDDILESNHIFHFSRFRLGHIFTKYMLTKVKGAGSEFTPLKGVGEQAVDRGGVNTRSVQECALVK